MIILIGTGHVFDLSDALIDIFDEDQPDTICVELDTQRYQQLLLKQQHPEQRKQVQKNTPVVYRMLARFQENLAGKYGVTPGEEMLTAIQYAQNHQLPLHLIDMNAQKVFAQMLKDMTVREKLRLFFSGFAGLFVSQKRVESELNKIQGDFTSYIDEIGKKFPTIKHALIDKRNQFMFHKLKYLSEDFETIAVVIGDGHIQGLKQLLEENDSELKVVRLKDLRKQKRSSVDAATASFSIEYKGM
ncbi:MAG: TraB/GumN family protein [Thermoplasmatota archaeon]